MAPVAPVRLGKSPLVSSCRLAREREKNIYIPLFPGHPLINSIIWCTPDRRFKDTAVILAISAQ